MRVVFLRGMRRSHLGLAAKYDVDAGSTPHSKQYYGNLARTERRIANAYETALILLGHEPDEPGEQPAATVPAPEPSAKAA